MSNISRRKFVQTAGSAAAVGALGFPAISMAGSHGGKKKVVVVGGGVGGATAAKYIKMGDSSIDVTLIEPNTEYFTCFMSNEVLGGARTMESIRVTYDGLKGHGINVVHDTVNGIDGASKKITTAGGKTFMFDRAVVAPGISFADNIEGYDAAAMEKMPHAWKAGAQTVNLRKQLEAMDDGGVVMIAPPPNPFRCPPGPYERACQIANYLKNHKPKSKVVIIDKKNKFSKMGLFTQAFDRYYKDHIEWHSADSTGGGVTSVDAATGTVVTGDGNKHTPAVANIIPAQKAGKVALDNGLANEKGWCPIDGKTFESTMQANVHVIGDASVASPLPKSGYAANSEAKVCAAAIVDLLNGREPGDPSLVNTCYSIVAPEDGISVAMVYDMKDGKLSKVKGSGGLTKKDSSPEWRAREVQYGYSWFENIKKDSWG
ncbi:MAG: FCSD flavin-binding domain-containing protein [Gammaproteobacteria bacterium]